jgi:hypothetical protein
VVSEIRILQANDRAVLDNVASGVFDNALDSRLVAEFLGDDRHHLAVAILPPEGANASYRPGVLNRRGASSDARFTESIYGPCRSAVRRAARRECISPGRTMAVERRPRGESPQGMRRTHHAGRAPREPLHYRTAKVRMSSASCGRPRRRDPLDAMVTLWRVRARCSRWDKPL